MNIFALDKSPQKAAEYHCDSHASKMVLEYAQLLSTCHRVLDGTVVIKPSSTGKTKVKSYELPDEKRNSVLYRACHVNHPCSKWLREGSANYEWLWNLYFLLGQEYTYRYGKVHKSSTLEQTLAQFPDNIPVTEKVTDFAVADGVTKGNRPVSEAVQLYRRYYTEDKAHLLTYTKRKTPEFICEVN